MIFKVALSAGRSQAAIGGVEFDLKRGMADAEMGFRLARHAVQEGVVEARVRPNEVRCERGFGRADCPDVQQFEKRNARLLTSTQAFLASSKQVFDVYCHE